MMRKIQTAYTRAPAHTIAVMGDSLSENFGLWGVPPQQMWPELLATSLRALGCSVRARNFGKSGDTTTGMVARQSALTLYEVPDIAIIWGGVNDPGASIVGATTQANIQTMIQTCLSGGCSRVVVVNTQYQNFSAGGDTTSTPSATYATLRPFQAAAVTAFSGSSLGTVVLCDLYESMRQLIVVGTETQGSNSWHAQVNNQHLNLLGNQYVAAAVLATIQAQNGWVEALQV